MSKEDIYNKIIELRKGEEKINIKVDLLESPSIMKFVSSKISAVLSIFLLFTVTFFVLFSKFSQKRNGRLTQKQTDEMEEKVGSTQKKYSYEKR